MDFFNIITLLIAGGAVFLAIKANQKGAVTATAPLARFKVASPATPVPVFTSTPVGGATPPGNPIMYSLVGFLVAGAIFYYLDKYTTHPDHTPSVPDTVGLSKVFAANDNRSEARTHAKQFSVICDEIAGLIEYDAGTKRPRFSTGVQLDDLRRNYRENRMRGFSFQTKYPDLAKALDVYFKEQLGASGGGGELTLARKQKWVSCLKVISIEAEKVSKGS